LEEDLGVALLVRSKRRVELAKAGHAFLEQARKLIVQAGNATEAARHAQKGESGIVRIALASGLGGVVSKVVFEHRKHFPAVEIECKDIFSTLPNEALYKDEIDIGFLRPPVDQLNLGCELLFEEEFVVVLPKAHRLAKRRSLRLKGCRRRTADRFRPKLLHRALRQDPRSVQ
jgi:DNA-binding transcriptional LysR family regulator